jgi:hypothetical protein
LLKSIEENNMAKTLRTPLTLAQKIWGLIAILALVSGLTLAILGLLRDGLAVPYDQNWIRIAENAMNEFLATDFSWQVWGTMLLVIGAVIFTLLMNRLASEEDKLKEKALRRAQRLQDAKIAE